MASQGEHHVHLDATAGREVVFCHACSNEWYRDDHGLTCPECHGEITEIIDPDNDPRDLEHRSSASTSPEIGPFRYHDDDSDPEEGNIDEHLGPHGFGFRRSVRDGPDPHHHNPAVDPVLERFLDMIQGFAPSRRPGGPGGSFPSSPGERPGDHDPFAPRIHRTTFTSGPFGGGTTSVTIVSGPIHGSRGGPPMQGADPFQMYAQPPPSRPQGPNGLRVMAVTMTIGANQRARLFSNMMRDIGPPGEGNQGGDEGPGGGPPPGFARSLHDILSLLNPANAMAGDAVYSQEALDRIITGLMEANPQSNAAPPATEEALRNLERKPVNKEMLGTEGKAECTICIDEMKEGDMATFLPCKHWFHEDCVVLWLKEHNTCPICRTPIEKNDRSGNNNNASNNNNSGNNSSNRPQGSPSGQSSGRPSPFGPPPGFGGGSGWFSGGSPGWGGSAENAGGPPSRPVRYSRPPSQSQSRLNEALRNISSMQRERERDRDRDRDRDRGTSSGFSYDTSRMQRRSSHSPTSPRAAAPGEHGARMRQRSPSESSRRTEDSDQRRQGHGPISWLRDRFGGGSGNGSSRDGRRQ
ncbi:RING-type domain-containing protein [Fusarium sp. Ph1]|nr:RING-type domain-containing protein [Fusarium sp. Ph1]